MSKGSRFVADFREYEKWVRNLREAKDHLDDEVFVNLLVRLAGEILRRTQKRTPVQTGDLRRAWHLGDIVKSGNIVGIEIINDSRHTGERYEQIYGKENVGYYASFIENGFRFPDGNFYEGRFMLAISMNEVKAIIPREFNKAFDVWIKSKEI